MAEVRRVSRRSMTVCRRTHCHATLEFFYLQTFPNRTMSYKRKGQLSASPERHRHLRPYLQRVFWKKERRAEKAILRDEEREAEEVMYATGEDEVLSIPRR